MPDVPEPPRKEYRFKPREFERVNTTPGVPVPAPVPPAAPPRPPGGTAPPAVRSGPAET